MNNTRDIVVGVIKGIIVIAVIVLVVTVIKNFLMPEVTDVTELVDKDKAVVERMLGVTLSDDSDMVKKIYEWTKGEITTDSDGDIAIVYVDGKRTGLHIDHKKYGMYGLKIGDWMVNVDKLTTYDYEGSFIVINDECEGMSTGVHYYNKKNNDCLIVIYNDNSNKVVALTYFNDFNKIAEQLGGI